MDTKMVIIIRKDLKVRRGKECVQSAHGSQAWLIQKIGQPALQYSKEEMNWMMTGTKKVCLQVDSEKELDELYWKAKKAGLTVHMVIDAGKTEFEGRATKTVICIGPNLSEDIDKLTSELKLY